MKSVAHFGRRSNFLSPVRLLIQEDNELNPPHSKGRPIIGVCRILYEGGGGAPPPSFRALPYEPIGMCIDIDQTLRCGYG